MPDEYPQVLVSTLALSVICHMMPFFIVTPARMRIFNKEFMNQFNEEHAEAFPGTEPAVGGFPDIGDGRYSDKLSYKQW
eukprot:CAMPEP_0116880588 /NCGR_PEP_ID=MMETSP0463-20121206/12526_1 /TAXON_ID=181622 /ORGANISM="Strombidinopsis sp, Strain SopsisLIS2011" /LENGTH=78 /DNA_ID=CAMNT_0004531335 /DNA_START=41 /DNA_END=274 /DNA_ORIENTATION=+